MYLGRSLRVLGLLTILACHTPAARAPAPVVASPPPPVAPAPPPAPQRLDLDSQDILARPPTTSTVLVRHVLVAWAALAAKYPIDPRAKQRTQAEAARLTEEIAAKLRANPAALDALIAAHSEDPGSLAKEPYSVAPDSAFVVAFKNLAQRLEVGEVGIVQTEFGYHVVVRVAPPPPDPLESVEILARAATAGPVDVQHIVIGWQGLTSARDPRAQTRAKADADALASEILAKVRAGDDMAALMKQYSEDPGTRDTAKPYTVQADSPMVEPFKQLALRLRIDEAGLVKTAFGWHVVKRIPPPPPDPLESAAILQRTTTVEHARVKHILLGWTAAHAQDPRGITRTRAQLDKLVKATLAKLAKKGAAIEPLMAELSEDPGSAKSGTAYDVSANGGFVKPFQDLALRLEVNEVGVVATTFGIHIIKRVE